MKKIKNILYMGTALLLTGCADEYTADVSAASPAEGKTPLHIEATLSTGSNVTRAAGQEFASGDELLAYLRHITGDTQGNYTIPGTDVVADQAPRLITFTKGSVAMGDKTQNDGIKETGDLTVSYINTDNTITTALYWDDFSDSRSADTDLRTSGHGLQSYYGYCYNGGTPSTDLVEKTGVLGWTVGVDQNSADAIKKADLLWSAEQEKVEYAHSNAHNGLTIPYTHAMSQVTVTVTAGEGFTGNPLTNTVLTLNAMNTVASLTAPTQQYSSDTEARITMFAETYSSGLIRNFTAIVAPGTMLKEGVKLLDITNVEDNNYTLSITGTSNGMLKSDAWGNGHDVETDNGTYILTKPGVNYHLDVTVNKTKIEVLATIQDWATVNATGTGEIQFLNDMVTIDVTGSQFANESTFSLFQCNANATATNDNYSFTTVPKYNATGIKWTNTPLIYWPNQTTRYFFRALAKFDSKSNEGVYTTTSVGQLSSNKGTIVSQGTIADGHDILWATTPAHNRQGTEESYTYNYARGAAIAPRTGNVPLAFEHAMSKITINLETTNDEEVTVNNAKVELAEADIAISNLSTSGTINIDDGSIDPATVTAEGIAATSAPITEYIVIPQTIADNAKLTITLKDGTTYSLKLKDCVETGTQTAVGQWERGKHYTYTIHLEKEQIQFRALIKEWDEKQGSGEANLEWD